MFVVRAQGRARGVVGKGLLRVEAGNAVRSAVTSEPFPRRQGILFCEHVSVERIAAAVGTPCFIYSAGAIRGSYEELADALSGVPNRVHYSAKANSNLAILSLLRGIGAGVDVVSGGELHRALRAGFADDDIVFGGVAKTDEELHMAVVRDLKLVNVESENELERLSQVALAHDRVVNVAIRVNPEVTVDTPHPYTRTGIRGMKFGIPYDRALEAAARVRSLPALRLCGLGFHIGSQILSPDPYRAALARASGLIEEVRREGAPHLRYLDVGGGLGVTYEEESPLDPGHFAALVGGAANSLSLELIVEPGRLITGNSGILVARVIDLKHSGGKDFVLVNAGMNDLLRPSHYGAYHRVTAVRRRDEQGTRRVDIVGPVCESGDYLALDREIEDVAVGDLIAVASAGAYGFCMSSNYNSRARGAEVLVDGDRFAVIRERESFDDLVRNERAEPRWLSGG
jgi:diaminopimelate decarboxylase